MKYEITYKEENGLLYPDFVLQEQARYPIDITAKEQVRLITAQLAQSHGIDENLKAADSLEWVAQMNSCKATAEEIVISEVIYQ